MTTPLHPGLLLVHKRPGETSFEVVQAITRAQPEGKARLPVSHAGALDPFAEGLLILLVGPATRLMDALHVAPKRYVAEVVWGAETDTGDAGGQRVGLPTRARQLGAQPGAALKAEHVDASLPAQRFDGSLTAERLDATLKAEHLDASPMTERLDAALTAFLGWRGQTPPATSNKRVEGERAYEKAHRGEPVTLPPSRVYLHEARWLSHALPETSTLELVCGGGFYVRALARDLGRTLGVGAHLKTLKRTQIGPWSDPPGEPIAVAGRELLPWLAAREVTDFEAGALRQGGTIRVGSVKPPDWPLPAGLAEGPLPIRAFQKDRLIALLKEDGDRLHSSVWLRGM